MNPESLQNIIDNLKSEGVETKSVTKKSNDIYVDYDKLQIHIDKNEDTVYFSIRIGYDTKNLPVTFSKEKADYLANKGIDDWSIYKYWLEFYYSNKDEKDLETTLKELLEEYN